MELFNGSIIGFIIWTIVAALMFGTGVCAFRAKDPVGFWTGVKPPEVKDVRKYNRAVGGLWFAYAGVLELLGVPMLFLKQNSPWFLPVIFGTVAATLGLMIAYLVVLRKHRKSVFDDDTPENVSYSVDRIREMEALYEEALRLLEWAEEDPEAFEAFRPEIRKLEIYYASPMWKADFEADEQGLLPPDLKRGVLSEDGLHNLLDCATVSGNLAH